MVRIVSRIVWAACFVLTAPLVAGCSGAGADDQASVESGAVSLPLVTQANGHTYRLHDAFIQIFGPTFTTLSTSDDPNETVLSATLQTGSYFANLYAWTLERDDGSGNFQPIVATLVSSNFVNFSVDNGTTTTVTYVFQTDGVIVTVGSGDLKVRVSVNEVDAVCTPFAGDCPTGTWCPPTGHTGAPRACVAAGAVAVGEPCGGPADCVANASCYDLGDGPVCVALCPADAFETPCTTGGVCQKFGTDYGRCL
jgi:hypothetical protein